ARLADPGHPYWGQVTAEYDVGPLTIAPSIVLGPAPAAVTDEEIRALLDTELDGTHPEWPAVTDDTRYLLVYPLAPTIMASATSTSCTNFGGYHNERASGSTSVVYAVIPRCQQATQLDELDEITIAIAHELVEAA